MVPSIGIPEPRGNPTGVVEELPGVRPHRLDTAVLLCIACGLIVNSHLERFWPRSFFAVDGLLGNSLFYILSGFGIGSSLFSRRQRFGPFLARRLVRIYPAVIITVVLLIGVVGGRAYTIVNGQSPRTLDDAFRLLIWPTPFTYVRNIVAIYVIGYVVAWPRSRTILYAALAAASFLFLYESMRDSAALSPDAQLRLGSVPTSAYDSFDLALFLGGMIVAGSHTPSRRHFWSRAILAGLLCIAYFALKYAMVVRGVGAEFYPVLFVLVGAVSYLALGVLSDPAVIQPLRRVGWLAWVVDLVAGLTLEIYVVHQALISTFAGLATIPFPLNIVLLVLISVALAALLRMVTDPLRRWVDAMTQPAATAAQAAGSR
jgi:peptidoglycan/LPS O-acetylase OafA/YrhL